MKKILVGIFCLSLLSGCGNQQLFDTNYTFDYAVCSLPGIPERIEISKWNDYDGEQLQIVATDGKVYLVNSMYCALVKE